MDQPLIDQYNNINGDELEFYFDLAMNECQRWIEGVTRERFIDEDDFLYSLRHGTQLRKVVNRILPGAFDVNGSGSDSSSDFGPWTTDEDYYDENWVRRFLRICWKELQFKTKQLFRITDLEANIDDGSRQGRLTDEQTLAKVRRVIVTIDNLAKTYEQQPGFSGPRFDDSAVEAVVNYDHWLHCSGLEQTPSDPFQDNVRDVKIVLEHILRQVCISTTLSLPVTTSPICGVTFSNTTSTSGALTSDDFVNVRPFSVTMDPEVNEKVSKYLADLSVEDQLSETMSTSDYGGAYSQSTRSSSPGLDLERQSRRDNSKMIPTRFTETKTCAAHPNPLQFVSTNVGTSLAEQAKLQLRKVEEVKKYKDEMKKIEEEEDENVWQSKLDSWKSKRLTKRSTSVSALRCSEGQEESIDNWTPITNQSPTNIRKISLDSKLVDRKDEWPSERQVWHDLENKRSDCSRVQHQQNTESKLDGVRVTDKSLKTATMEDSGHFENEFDQHSEHSRQTSASSVEEEKGVIKVCDMPIIEPIVQKITNQPKPYVRFPVEEDIIDSGMETNRESLSPGGDSQSQSSLSPQSHTTSEGEERFIVRQNRYSSPVASIRKEQKMSEKDMPKWSYQQVDATVQELIITIHLRPNSEKGFGFSLKGGKGKHEPVTVDGVIFGSAADKARLQVGDQLVTINGENVTDKYLPKINHIIHEAQRLCEIELFIKRHHHGGITKMLPSPQSPVQRTPSPVKDVAFDQKRSLFDKPDQTDEYYKFRQSRRPVGRSWNMRPMRNPAAGAPVSRISSSAQYTPQDTYLTDHQQPGRIENFIPDVERDDRSPSPPGRRADYKVTSLGARRPVGKLTDFIPEVERSSSSEVSRSTSPASSRHDPDSKPTKTQKHTLQPLRNYDLGIHKITDSIKPEAQTEQELEQQPNIDMESEKMTTIEQDTKTELETMKSSDQNYQLTSERKSPVENEADVTAKSFLNEKLHRMAMTRRIREGINKARSRFFGIQLEEQQKSHISSDYVDLNVYRRWDQQREAYAKAERLLLSRNEYYEGPQRFLYRNNTIQPQRHPTTVHRNFSVLVVPIRNKDRTSEVRQRYDIIHQQRQPRPASPPHYQMTSPQSRPFSHVQRSVVFSSEPVPGSKSMAERRYVDSIPNILPPEPILPKSEPPPIMKERSPPPSYERYKEPELKYLNLAANNASYGPPSEQERGGKSNGNVKNQTDVCEHWLVHEATKTRLTDQLNSDRIREKSPEPRSQQFHQNGHYMQPEEKQEKSVALPEVSSNNDAEQEQIASVSGKQKCSHCSEELGKGAAMIIESLNLFYHLTCFRCYVCGSTLGNGAHGADVRVRAGKLHCQSCYSNDEAGLKYSEV